MVDLDRGVLDPAVHPLGLAVGPGMVGLGQAALDAIVEVGDGIPQAALHVVQRKHGLLAKGNDDGFLGGRRHRALRRLRTHRRIGCRRPPAPLARGPRIQVVAGGKGPATLFRRLEIATNTRGRAGAAVKNASQNASSS